MAYTKQNVPDNSSPGGDSIETAVLKNDDNVDDLYTALNAHDHSTGKGGTIAVANVTGAVAEADFNANTILAADTDNTPAALTIAEQTVVGRITSGNIVGLTAAQIRTLINVEDGATADQTNTEIRTAVGAAADSNVFTDALLSKLNGIESNATADQTGAQIKTAYESEADTNALTDALLSKLNGVETGADVTDTTNVAAAGAVMNSGNQTVAGVKTFSSFPTTPSSAPSTDYQTANKKYVDDNASAFSTTSLTGTSGTLTAAQCNGFTTFINSGVVTRILPTAAVGLRVSFLSTSTDSFKIYANTSDLISYGGSNTNSAGYIHLDVEGTYVELICTSTSEWRISVLTGSVKYDE